MKAKKGLSVKKEILGKNIPLDTPYLLYVFPIYACNFKCGYCLHSIDQKIDVYDQNYLRLDQFKKRIDQASAFNDKFKLVRFSGMGEPLLHHELAEMIAYVKERDVAEQVDIITNASLLTTEKTDQLINAGIDKIRISIQGLSSEAYLEKSSVKLDFDDLVSQIVYLYNHKQDTKIYIKIIDELISTEVERTMFFETFGDKCDEIDIEHIFPSSTKIDYSKFKRYNKNLQTVLGYEYCDVNICPQPFYTISLEPDNQIGACCSYDILGNVRISQSKNMTLKQVWESKELHEFQLKMLDGAQYACKICSKCLTYKTGGIHPNDHLDYYKDTIELRLKRR